MPTRTRRDQIDPRTCQDCAGIGRTWIEGLLQDCPECGGSGWESAAGSPSYGEFATFLPEYTEPQSPWKGSRVNLGMDGKEISWLMELARNDRRVAHVVARVLIRELRRAA